MKRKISLEEHRKNAAELLVARQAVFSVIERIADTPKTASHFTSLHKSCKDIDAARSRLENQMMKDHPDFAKSDEALKIYYPDSRDD